MPKWVQTLKTTALCGILICNICMFLAFKNSPGSHSSKFPLQHLWGHFVVMGTKQKLGGSHQGCSKWLWEPHVISGFIRLKSVLLPLILREVVWTVVPSGTHNSIFFNHSPSISWFTSPGHFVYSQLLKPERQTWFFQIWISSAIVSILPLEFDCQPYQWHTNEKCIPVVFRGHQGAEESKLAHLRAFC